MVEQNTDKEITSLVKQLYETFRKVGYKRVLTTLRTLIKHPENSNETEICQHIIEQTIKMYDCSHYDLKKPKISPHMNQAKRTCLILLKTHTTLNHKDIAGMFVPEGRDPHHSMVSHALKYKSSISPQVKDDREFLEKYNEIEKRILEYKSTKSKSQ